MFRAGARRVRLPPASQQLNARSMAASSQLTDGNSSPFKSYFVYSLTAATTGLIAYSFYNSLQSPYGGTRQYSSYDRADSSPGFTRKQYPDSQDKQDSKLESTGKDADKPQNSTYLGAIGGFGDRIKNSVVPEWAQQLPDDIAKLQKDLSNEPGTLADDIWKTAHDASVHPEIQDDAFVRVSDDLCQEEKDYLVKRKEHIRSALAKYLDIPVDDIHPDDVPTIGMCGSGGGLRAMVAGASSYLSAQDAGLFDCITYTAGVSGSCWLQALYNSSLTHQNFYNLIDHLKQRIGTHIAFPPPVLKLLTTAPTNKYLLAGGLEKWKGGNDAEFGLVDVYGLLLGARLLVPKGSLNIDPDDIKLSHQRKYFDDGANPLPIYCAVRHEIPPEENAEDENNKAFNPKEASRRQAWFQWFEFSPYEFFCEDFGSGIPTWAVGRRFDNGRSVVGDLPSYLPETRLPLLMGIFGSAFCATLSHYYKEIKPLVMGLPGFGSLDSLVGERDEDMVKVHPVAPAQIPNYATNMRDALPASCPESVHQSPSIQLMDAGMSNNLPIYPLLRPGRDVDVIVAFDASADIKQDNWLRVVDGYAKQRGIRGWPVGCGWPGDEDKSAAQTGKAMDEADKASPKEASSKLKQAAKDQAADDGQSASQQTKDGNAANRTENAPVQPTGEQAKPAPTTSSADSTGKGEPKPSDDESRTSLGYCSVWVGTTEQRTSTAEPPPEKTSDADPAWALREPHAGTAVVYFPFMANPAVAGVDPETSDFMSTWNFIYTPEDVDRVVALAKANFAEGEQRVKSTVRAVYERKRRLRLEHEAKEKEQRGGVWRIGGRQTLM